MTENASERIKQPTLKPDTYPFEMDYLPKEFQKKAELELNETPENRVNGMKQLRDLIDNENSLISSWLEDDLLIIFLRGRKFDVHSAFSSLKKSLTFIRTHKRYFNAKQYMVEIYIQEKILSFLPYRDKEGCAIGIILLPKWNPTVAPIDDTVVLDILFSFMAISYPMSQVNGLKLLLDFNVIGWKFIQYCTPFYAYLFYQIALGFVPARIKAVHIVNSTLAFKVFMSVFSKFLPDKVKKRFVIHDDVSELKNYFPENLIPECFGGHFPDYDISEWARKAKFPKIVQYLTGYNGIGN